MMNPKRRVELVREQGQDMIRVTDERGITLEHWNNSRYGAGGRRIPAEESFRDLVSGLRDREVITQQEYDNLLNQFQKSS